MSGLREAVERLTDAWDHDRDAYHVGAIHAAIVSDLRALLAEHPATPAEGNIVQRIVNAWDCCGTCAGGVLAAHDAALTAKAKAEAFDEGMWAAYNVERDGGDGSEVPNPYREPR